MLVCAEDLGMVPDCVHRVLERFRILSLEVQSMPKRNEGTFSWLPNNPYRSVDTITTHDMEPLRLWWKKFPDRAQLYFEQRMSGSGEVPEDLSPDMAEHIIRQHMASPSVLCIVALQDWLAIDGDMRNPDVEMEQVNHLPIRVITGVTECTLILKICSVPQRSMKRSGRCRRERIKLLKYKCSV